jgi:hypothetical protein
MRNYFPGFVLLGVILAAKHSAGAADSVGYKDTPMLPGTAWHVHDPDRPLPRVVTPGATFSHGAPPPSDAVMLFDGTDLSKWKSDKGEAKWKIENGYFEAVKGGGNIRTKEDFGDFQLHLEFATPEKVVGNSQGRGNSGVLIFGDYEVQVLDSYDNRTYADGQLGAMYGQYPPLVNPAKKPGEWQSYDIIFEAPQWTEEQSSAANSQNLQKLREELAALQAKYTDGYPSVQNVKQQIADLEKPGPKLVKRAAVTVILNGVAVHNRKEYIGRSVHKEIGTYNKLRASRGPIMLQDHGNPTRFRNIWIRNLGEYDKPAM